MYKIIWTHLKTCSYGYRLSDVSYIDKKGRYVFEDSFEMDTNENVIAGYVKTVISPKTVITTVTDASGNVKKKTIDKVVSLSFE